MLFRSGAGRTVDWLLVMRRLDEQRMLDAVIAAGTVTRADLDAVLQFLVSFYRSRDPLPFTAETYLRRLTARMDEALGAVQRSGTGLPPDRVEPFASELRAAVAALTPELGERATARHIAEVHGDLRAEHVCLGPPVQIIDALEVYADLRMLDTGEEIAMLALECERASSHWVPGYLRDSYRRLAADPLSGSDAEDDRARGSHLECPDGPSMMTTCAGHREESSRQARGTDGAQRARRPCLVGAP